MKYVFESFAGKDWDNEAALRDRGSSACGLRSNSWRCGQRRAGVDATRQGLNTAIVKADTAFLDQVLAQDYVHYRPRGTVENRAQYLENRKTGRVDYESVVEDELRVRVYGDTAIVTIALPPKERINRVP